MYSQHRRCQVAQPCVSPSPISRAGDCLHARHLLITQKAPLRHDATLPTPAPMFLVLRTRFATSAWGGRYVFATSSMPSCSTVRLSIAYFACGRLFICLIFTNHTSHFVLLKMLLSIAYFAWGRVIKCVSPPTISHGVERLSR